MPARQRPRSDIDDTWFSEAEFQILTELGDTIYDAVALSRPVWIV